MRHLLGLAVAALAAIGLVASSWSAYAGVPPKSEVVQLVPTTAIVTVGQSLQLTATTLKHGSTYVDAWTGASKFQTQLRPAGYADFYVSTAAFVTSTPGEYTVSYDITMRAGKSEVFWRGTASAAITVVAPRRVVFYSYEFGSADIFTMNPDGSGRARLTSSSDCEMLPRWSPDGTKIAYHQQPCGADNPSKIVVIRPDGSLVTEFTTTVGDLSHYIIWSPDGTKLAYTCGFTRLCIRNSDGSGSSSLVLDVSSMGKDGVQATDWSADGSKILVHLSASSTYSIWTVSPDGITRTQLVGSSSRSNTPSGARYSPDDTKIVFNRLDSSGVDSGYIAVANADGSGEQSLVTGVAFAYATDWAADGRIYFYSNAQNSSANEIYSIRTDGTGLLRLTNNSFADSAPQLSP